MESCGVWPKWLGYGCFAEGRVCGVMFYICSSCYRGQVYCGDECRRRMRRQQMRVANRKHQDSPEGRLDHRDRQRAYRERCSLRRVTDHTSAGRHSVRQYQGTMDKNAKKAALWGGISASAGIEAAPSRHPGRLHRVWAHAAVIGPEREKR